MRLSAGRRTARLAGRGVVLVGTVLLIFLAALLVRGSTGRRWVVEFGSDGVVTLAAPVTGALVAWALVVLLPPATALGLLLTRAPRGYGVAVALGWILGMIAVVAMFAFALQNSAAFD